jgi:hypothetical protein
MSIDIYLVKQEFFKHLKSQQEQIIKLLQLANKIGHSLPQYNEAIIALNNKIDQIAASQLILYTLYLQGDEEKKTHFVEQIERILGHVDFSKNPYLKKILEDFLAVLKQPPQDKKSPQQEEASPSRPVWFQGIVDGGKPSETNGTSDSQ